MPCNGDCNQGRECNCKCKMTDREEFEKWWRETKGTDIPYTGLASFTEDVMFSAWQARGELDAVRIKELEAKLDKARDGDCCTEGCIKCDARKVLAETQEPFDVVQDSKGNLVPLYTTPPSREWVGLSYEDIYETVGDGVSDIALAIEAKLREKNG